jgi:CHAD domain-containing protein
MSDETQAEIGSFLAAVAQKECQAVGKALANRRNRHRAIHEARKAIRRLRSLLALIRDSVGDDTSSIEQALRSQAKRLSALRDTHVVVAIAEKLAADDDTGVWAATAQALVERRDRLLADELARDPAFARRTAAIEDVATALQTLHWKRITPNAIRRAIKKSQRRVLRAEHDARQTATSADLHRWRRSARRLRLQLVAVAALNRSHGINVRLADAHRGKSAKALAHLADRLGKCQDIQVLRASLKTLPDLSILPILRKRLRVEMKLAKHQPLLHRR